MLHIIECFHKTHSSKILCFFQEETTQEVSQKLKKLHLLQLFNLVENSPTAQRYESPPAC
ncbi:hypothetical protein FOB92_06185 [Streptococcus mitis]|nr:hypothetical protein FOB92_06185 [Streptococcus mitis]